MEDVLMERECRKCGEVKPLEEFNKGNAKYGRKSECKICQRLRSKEYKKRPEVIKQDRAWQRQKYQKMNQEERTAYYLKNKAKVDAWNAANPDRCKASIKVRSARRQARLKEAGPIDLSSVITLQDYNIKTYGDGVNPYTCEYCLSKIEESYHLEHIIPVSKGGKSDLSNLAIVCPKCNLQKLTKSLEDFNSEACERIKNRKL